MKTMLARMVMMMAVGLTLDLQPPVRYNAGVTCQTAYNALLNRHETRCTDGMVIHSRWNDLLQRFESVVVNPPRQSAPHLAPQKPPYPRR